MEPHGLIRLLFLQILSIQSLTQTVPTLQWVILEPFTPPPMEPHGMNKFLGHQADFGESPMETVLS